MSNKQKEITYSVVGKNGTVHKVTLPIWDLTGFETEESIAEGTKNLKKRKKTKGGRRHKKNKKSKKTRKKRRKSRKTKRKRRKSRRKKK